MSLQDFLVCSEEVASRDLNVTFQSSMCTLSMRSHYIIEMMMLTCLGLDKFLLFWQSLSLNICNNSWRIVSIILEDFLGLIKFHLSFCCNNSSPMLYKVIPWFSTCISL